MIFFKNDYDTLNLSVQIKLYKNTNYDVDQSNMPTKQFSGDLFIDVNYMNDKRKLEELQKLNNCLINCKESTFLNQKSIVLCNIAYQKRIVSAWFDSQNNKLTIINIY